MFYMVLQDARWHGYMILENSFTVSGKNNNNNNLVRKTTFVIVLLQKAFGTVYH